jgi:tRNA(Ile)-lysidine synthase
LLPELEKWNKRVREHFAQMAELARDEESWIDGLIAKEAVWAIKEGKPVRGGGRGESTSGLALELERVKTLPVAVQRRLIRVAAERLGLKLNFEATEGLRKLAESGRAGDKYEAADGLRAERTARELRLTVASASASEAEMEGPVEFEVPGEVEGFGVRLKVEGPAGVRGVLRNWKAGDRVRMRYTSGEKKVKEVLERMKVQGSERGVWPVVEFEGRIVWMKGVEVESQGVVKVSLIS